MPAAAPLRKNMMMWGHWFFARVNASDAETVFASLPCWVISVMKINVVYKRIVYSVCIYAYSFIHTHIHTYIQKRTHYTPAFRACRELWIQTVNVQATFASSLDMTCAPTLFLCTHDSYLYK